jgi:hypothetical protein
VALFYGGLVAGALLVAYGVAPFPALIRALPVANTINHQRLLQVVDFGAAVLAGVGLDAILRAAPDQRPKRLAIGFAAVVAIALLSVWTVIGDGYARLDDSSRQFVLGQLWIVGGGVAAAFVVTLRQLSAKWIGMVAVAFVAGDLLWFATGYNPAIPASLYYPTTDGIRMLQREPSRARVLGQGRVLSPDSAAVYGLDDVRGMDFMGIKRYEELITGTAGDLFFYRSANVLPPSFPLLNVKYVLLPERLPADPEGFELVYSDEMAIYRNSRAADRALIVFDHEVERDAATVLARVRSGSFDPAKTLLLEDAPATGAPGHRSFDRVRRDAHRDLRARSRGDRRELAAAGIPAAPRQLLPGLARGREWARGADPSRGLHVSRGRAARRRDDGRVRLPADELPHRRDRVDRRDRRSCDCGRVGPPPGHSSSTWRMSTQSGSLSRLSPGGRNSRSPELANGLPLNDRNEPLLGSNQRARTGPEN